MLIAGCFYKEAYLSSMDMNKGVQYVDSLDRVNQLLLKAIDLSLIHTEYHNDRMAKDENYRKKRLPSKQCS